MDEIDELKQLKEMKELLNCNGDGGDGGGDDGEDDDIVLPTEEEIAELYPQEWTTTDISVKPLFWADGPYRLITRRDKHFTISMGGPVGFPTHTNVPWIRIDGSFDTQRAAMTHAARVHGVQPCVATGVVTAGAELVFPLASTTEQHCERLLSIRQCLDDELRAKEIDMALRHREAKRVSRDTEEYVRVRRRLVFTKREDLLPPGDTPTLPRLPGEPSAWDLWKVEHPDLYQEGLAWETPIPM